MKIKVLRTIPDDNGSELPDDMIGKTYKVQSESVDGYWVKTEDGNYLVMHGEYEVVNELTYFQDYVDNDILIRGHIDPITKQGEAYVYSLSHTVAIDLNEIGVKDNPYLVKEYAVKFANDALERVSK
jgi:hypothetical protein